MSHDTVKPEQYYISLDGTPPEAISQDADDFIVFSWWPGEAYRPKIELCTNGYTMELSPETIEVIIRRLRNAADMTFRFRPDPPRKIITETFPTEETAMKLAIPTEVLPPHCGSMPTIKQYPTKHDFPFAELAIICRKLGIRDA